MALRAAAPAYQISAKTFRLKLGCAARCPRGVSCWRAIPGLAALSPAHRGAHGVLARRTPVPVTLALSASSRLLRSRSSATLKRTHGGRRLQSVGLPGRIRTARKTAAHNVLRDRVQACHSFPIKAAHYGREGHQVHKVRRGTGRIRTKSAERRTPALERMRSGVAS